MNPKPLVQVACICEKVLREPDNVASLIRIVDTFQVEPLPEPLPTGLKGALPLTIFIQLRSGEVEGEHAIALRLLRPDGRTNTRSWTLRFNGGEHGANLQIAFMLETPEFGLYWFDVMWGDETLTRMPLRVLPKSAGTAGAPIERASSPPQTVS